MEDVPSADLNERQALQVDVTLGRRPGPEVIDPRLFSKLDAWEFPLHFVDFETIILRSRFTPDATLPEPGIQFSCHHLGTDGSITHEEWLKTDAGEFPNWNFLVALRKALGDEGTILRYALHENTILTHLRDQLRAACRPLPTGFDIEDTCAWIDSILVNGARAMVGHVPARAGPLLPRTYAWLELDQGGTSGRLECKPPPEADLRRAARLWHKPLRDDTLAA